MLIFGRTTGIWNVSYRLTLIDNSLQKFICAMKPLDEYIKDQLMRQLI